MTSPVVASDFGLGMGYVSLEFMDTAGRLQMLVMEYSVRRDTVEFRLTHGRSGTERCVGIANREVLRIWLDIYPARYREPLFVDDLVLTVDTEFDREGAVIFHIPEALVPWILSPTDIRQLKDLVGGRAA
jgi:hypothetical protein